MPSEPSSPQSPPERAEGPQNPLRVISKTKEAGSTSISEVVAKMGKVDKRSGRATDKTIEQCAGIAALFVEITGISDVCAIRQRHIADFVDAMDKLPPVYRRSTKDREKPIADIIADAKRSEAKTGLSSATINRNLVQLGKILAYAKSQDLPVNPNLDPSQLRRFEKKSAKDDRDPFTSKDVKMIFAAPVWRGSKSGKRRRTPGSVIVKDWLYWVPLIAAYTGARREDICGLETADIIEEDGMPIILIRPNSRRGLKNAQSERRIPVHSHLIDLGFLDYVRDQRARSRVHLFHDLKWKSPKSQIGGSTAYLWRNIQNDQIGPQEKKSFHSFRHFEVQGLRSESDVEKHVRAELFGHLVGNIEDDRYGGHSPVGMLRASIEALPRVF